MEPATMERYTYPHAIENGAGERLTFLRRVPGPAGDRIEAENLVKPGAGPPMHVHHYQEEALTVQQGSIGYQRLGEPAQFAGPGETSSSSRARRTGSGTPERTTFGARGTSSRPTTWSTSSPRSLPRPSAADERGPIRSRRRS
jgi:hypothetical protein